MRPISHITLQKKYGGMWVAFNKSETRVLATDKTFDNLHKYLEKKRIDTSQVVFAKIQKYGTISVYFQ